MPDTIPPAPDHEAPQPELSDDQPVNVASKTTVTPVVAMTFIIVVLLVILIVMRFSSPSKDQELADLQAEIDQLNRHSGTAGMPGLGGEQLQDIAARMKKDADSMMLLADRYKQLIDEINADLVRKNSDLLRSEQYRQGMSNDLMRLKSELQQAKSGAYEVDSLRREVADLKTLREAQTAELAALKQQLASVGELASAADMADLQRRFDETLRAKEFFEARAAELTAALANQQKLFAKSEDELLPAAVALFKTLRQLEIQPGTDLNQTYARIGVEQGAAVVKTLTFPTGIAQLNPADEEPVRQLIAGVPDGDMLFVVGYASVTGNVNGNRKLSSDRATGVAELLTTVKRPDQKVQAVYLGQTDRFSRSIPERNQCCEIWHIRAKE